MEIVYNKLVRDLIPKIIKKAGKTPEYEVLSQADYIETLENKLDEETAEYHASKNVEELADILEVIYALAENSGCSVDELERIRARKAQERGGFKKRLFLKKVIEE